MSKHYGIVGTGEVDFRAAKANLDDLIDAASGEEIVFHFAMYGEDWGGLQDEIIDHLVAQDVGIHIVHDAAAAKDADLKVLIDNAQESVKVVRPVEKMVADIAEVGGEVLILWDEEATDPENENYNENDSGYTAFDLAYQASIRCLDLTNGLEVLEAEGEEEEEPAEAAEEDAKVVDIRSKGKATGTTSSAFPTEEELRAMKRPALKALAEENGLELSDRAHTPTIVEALTKHFRTLAKTTPTTTVTPTSATSSVSGTLDYAQALQGGISQEDFDEFSKKMIESVDGLTEELKKNFKYLTKDFEAAQEKTSEAITGLADKFEAFTETLIKTLEKTSKVEDEPQEETSSSKRAAPRRVRRS